MALLKSPNTTPPGGFRYFQTETEFTIDAENLDALVAKVVAHREYRNLHPKDKESVRLDVERYICIRQDSSVCRKEDKSDPWVAQEEPRIRFTMGAVIGFSKAALEFVKTGMKLVPMEEAQRRAEICKRCPQNREMTGCACNTFHLMVAAAVPVERRIASLGVCFACGCDLKSKVNLEESVIVESNAGRNIDFPSFCWQRSILEKAKEPVSPA